MPRFSKRARWVDRGWKYEIRDQSKRLTPQLACVCPGKGNVWHDSVSGDGVGGVRTPGRIGGGVPAGPSKVRIRYRRIVDLPRHTLPQP